MTRDRRAPLTAGDGPSTEPGNGTAPPPPPSNTGGVDVVHTSESHVRTSEDRRAFAGAVQALRSSGGALNLSERTLMVAGGVVAPIGLLCIVLAWIGASRTPNLFEQIPYLISGGLLGLALVFLGSFLYFAHWVTELVKEQRAGSAALLDAIDRLHSRLDATASESAMTTPGKTESDNGHQYLVATQRGSMAHRPECPVVADKDGLRTVTSADQLAPCKLCDPYRVDESSTPT